MSDILIETVQDVLVEKNNKSGTKIIILVVLWTLIIDQTVNNDTFII